MEHVELGLINTNIWCLLDDAFKSCSREPRHYVVALNWRADQDFRLESYQREYCWIYFSSHKEVLNLITSLTVR